MVMKLFYYNSSIAIRFSNTFLTTIATLQGYCLICTGYSPGLWQLWVIKLFYYITIIIIITFSNNLLTTIATLQGCCFEDVQCICTGHSP